MTTVAREADSRFDKYANWLEGIAEKSDNGQTVFLSTRAMQEFIAGLEYLEAPVATHRFHRFVDEKSDFGHKDLGIPPRDMAKAAGKIMTQLRRESRAEITSRFPYQLF